jgi:CRP/FNR family transcriptional regulator
MPQKRKAEVMIVESLKKSVIFSALNDSEIKEVKNLFEKSSFKKDEYIFMEDDPSDWFYLVADGRVKVVKHTHSGKDVILEIMSPGDVFGGVAVLDKKPFPASAQAMEPVIVIRISRKNLFHIMEEHPALKLSIVKDFSDRLRNAHETLKNIATERVEKRIASLLLKLSEKVGIDDKGYKKIDFPPTRQEIAEMVGTTVETCIRTMSRFQTEGKVKSSGGKILVNVDALNEFLEEL